MNESPAPRRSRARTIGLVLALVLPAGLAWWLQSGPSDTGVRDDVDAWRADVVATLDALPAPRGEARFRAGWPAEATRYRLSVRMIDRSASAAAITGIPDDGFERGIARRSRDHVVAWTPPADPTADDTGRLVLNPEGDDETHASFSLHPASGALSFSPDSPANPPAGGRDARTWLAVEVGLYWPRLDAAPASAFARSALPETLESFKAAQIRSDLEVKILTHDRRESAAWFDEDGTRSALGYFSAVLDGEHWSGRQETILRARLEATGAASSPPLLSGDWETEERFRLRRDAPTTAEATHRIVIRQDLVPIRSEDVSPPPNGR